MDFIENLFQRTIFNSSDTKAMLKSRAHTIKVHPYQISGSGRFYHFKFTPEYSNKVEEKKNIPCFWRKCLNGVRHFCDATTLHGFKYVSEEDRPNYERVYWLIAIVAAYCLVTLVVYDQIERFLRNPVLISMEPILTSVSKIPFPAITLCPDSQILSTTYNLSWAIQQPFNSTVKRDEAYNYAMVVCHLHDFTMKNLHLNTFNPEFIHKMMNAINGEDYCKKLISNVIWAGGLLHKSCQYFQPTITYFGACLTFNMLPQDQMFKLPNVTVCTPTS